MPTCDRFNWVKTAFNSHLKSGFQNKSKMASRACCQNYFSLGITYISDTLVWVIWEAFKWKLPWRQTRAPRHQTRGSATSTPIIEKFSLISMVRVKNSHKSNINAGLWLFTTKLYIQPLKLVKRNKGNCKWQKGIQIELAEWKTTNQYNELH